MPTQASGDASINRLSGKRLVVAKAGVGRIDSRIGAKASDTSTEGMMKRMKPDTSPRTRMYCAVTMPPIWTIM